MGYDYEFNICNHINGWWSNVCSSYGECIAPNNCSWLPGFTGNNCSIVTNEFLNVTVVESSKFYCTLHSSLK